MGQKLSPSLLQDFQRVTGAENASLSIKVPPGKGSAVCRGVWGSDSPAPEGPVQKSQLVVTPTFYPR